MLVDVSYDPWNRVRWAHEHTTLFPIPVFTSAGLNVKRCLVRAILSVSSKCASLPRLFGSDVARPFVVQSKVSQHSLLVYPIHGTCALCTATR